MDRRKKTLPARSETMIVAIHQNISAFFANENRGKSFIRNCVLYIASASCFLVISRGVRETIVVGLF